MLNRTNQLVINIIQLTEPSDDESSRKNVTDWSWTITIYSDCQIWQSFNFYLNFNYLWLHNRKTWGTKRYSVTTGAQNFEGCAYQTKRGSTEDLETTWEDRPSGFGCSRDDGILGDACTNVKTLLRCTHTLCTSNNSVCDMASHAVPHLLYDMREKCSRYMGNSSHFPPVSFEHKGLTEDRYSGLPCTTSSSTAGHQIGAPI